MKMRLRPVEPEDRAAVERDLRHALGDGHWHDLDELSGCVRLGQSQIMEAFEDFVGPCRGKRMREVVREGKLRLVDDIAARIAERRKGAGQYEYRLRIGRPAEFRDRVRLQVFLDRAELAALQGAADAADLSVSGFAREVIVAALTERKEK